MNITLMSADLETTATGELESVELTSTEMRLISGGEAVVVFE